MAAPCIVSVSEHASYFNLFPEPTLDLSTQLQFKTKPNFTLSNFNSLRINLFDLFCNL